MRLSSFRLCSCVGLLVGGVAAGCGSDDDDAGGGAGVGGTGGAGATAGEGSSEGGVSSAGEPGEGAGAGGTDGACPLERAPVEVGELDAALDEASGLTASRANAGVFYAHNDSSSPIYAIAEDGAVVATLELPGALVLDWEDVAVGPGPDPGASYLYVGDIGDNDLSRNPSIFVQRAREPALDPAGRGASVVLEFDTLYFRYPDAPHNAEAMLVDPESADLYIVTKDEAGDSQVFVGRAPHGTSAIAPLEPVTALAFGSAGLPGSPLATGASIASDGSRLLVRTYDSAFLWERAPGASIAEAFAGAPCALGVPDEPQGEAITFAPDGASYYTTSEGSGAALFRVDLE